jgi:HAMP domain-containing protein
MSTGSDQSSGSAAPPAAGAGGRHQRKVRNYLLDTALQLKLASYLLGVALLLSVGLCGLLWQAWQETSRVIALGAPEVADSLTRALASEDRGRMLLVAAALAGVLLCLLLASVVITHRIAGPAFALRRTCQQVAEGKLAVPRPLRSGDLLLDLGGEVAGMVQALREREAREREVLLLAARTLRDAGGAEARSAAGALDRLVGQKEERLKG